MGLFKKVFGKSTPAQDKVVEQEVEQIKSGDIQKIYPILKPGNWVGIQSGAIKQTIFGAPENPELVAGFGYDAPDNFIFLTHKDIEGKDGKQILDEAYDNLDKIEVKFETSEKLGDQLLFASGHDFSAEKILSPEHMLKAHKLLKSDKLMVSIPRRTCMYIIPDIVSEDLLEEFKLLHRNTWEDDSYGNAQILNAYFIVENGEVESYTLAEGSEAKSENPELEIDPVLFDLIKDLSKKGDALAEEEKYNEAIDIYWEAFDLIPDPKKQWDTTTWVLTAIGDALFLGDKFDVALDNLNSAMSCPGAIGNPFLHLRLGQCHFELGNTDKAADELTRAFSIEGEEIFSLDDPKYLKFVQERMS